MRFGVGQDAADATFDERVAQLDAALAAAPRRSISSSAPDFSRPATGPVESVAACDETAAHAGEAAFGEVARRHRTALVYGTVDHTAHGRHNAARLVDRDGRPVARHAKRALPPFAVETLFEPGAETTVVA